MPPSTRQSNPRDEEQEEDVYGNRSSQRTPLNRMPTTRTRRAMEQNYFGRDIMPHRESMFRLDTNFLTQPSVSMARRFIPSVYSTDFTEMPYFNPSDSLSYGSSPQLYRNENSFRTTTPPPPPVPKIPASYSTPDIPIIELPADAPYEDRPQFERSATDPNLQRPVSTSSSFIGASISPRPYRDYVADNDQPFQEPLYRGPSKRDSRFYQASSVRRESVYRDSTSMYRDSIDAGSRYSDHDLNSPANDEPPLPVVAPLRLNTQPPPPPSVTGMRFYMAIGTLCLINLLLAVETTTLPLALPTIAKDKNLTALQSFWLGTSSLLAATVIQPLFSALAEMLGRQMIAITSIALLAVGSVVGGLAPNVQVLIAARAIQGFGSGGCLTVTYAVTTDLVSLKNRGKWFGIVSISWAVGTILGPMVGGAFAENSWRWIFWINLPFCGLAIVASFMTLAIPPRYPPTFMGLWHFDWAGTIIFGGSVLALLFAFSWGGATYKWGSSEVVVAIFMGGLGLLAFVAHLFISPAYSPALPLIRISIFSKSSVGAYLTTITHGMVVYAIIYLLPIYEQVRGRTPLNSAVAMLPLTLTVVPTAIIVGLSISRVGQYHPFVWIGWIMMLLGTGFFMALNTHTATADFILIFIPAGIGLGMIFSALSYAAQANAPASELPFAASTYAFCRTLGGAFGVAAGGIAFQNEFMAQIKKSEGFEDKAEEWTKNLVAMVAEIKDMSGDQKDVVVDGAIDGLYRAWMLLCIISAISLALAVLMIKEKRFNQGYLHQPLPQDVPTNRIESMDTITRVKNAGI